MVPRKAGTKAPKGERDVHATPVRLSHFRRRDLPRPSLFRSVFRPIFEREIELEPQVDIEREVEIAKR